MATPAELAASLTLDEIPVKLRCAACNQLALDAYRTPCCDQSICETCQKSLGPGCPICLHEPVNADDCRPNKALRTTVKAFIKKRGIDKQEAVKKEIASKAHKVSGTPTNAKNDEASADQASRPSMTPTADAAAVKTGISLASGLQENSEALQASQQRLETERKADGKFSPLEAQKDIARPSIESGNQDPQKQENEDQSGSAIGTAEGVDQDEQSMRKSQVPESQQNQEQMPGSSEQQWAATNGPAQQGMNNGGFGFEGINGGLPNMGFGNVADFNQMMQLMPNAMQNNMMGMFPNMMSMPGMGMDPMTMAQGLYGGFNGQGIGMNGMNAGMGFANGQIAYGGFNGQPASWNGVHNNYNQNAYGGHANSQVGDYGSNAGYGGYNLPQGNFNQMNQRQFSNNDFQHGHYGQGFPNRGRGRGRGYQNYGRGRGGYNQVNSVHQANSEASPSQVPPQLAASQGPSQQQDSNQEQHTDGIIRRGSPVYDTETRKSADDFSKSLDPGDAEDHAQSPNKEQTKEDNNVASDENTDTQTHAEEKPAIDSLTKDEAQEKPSAAETATVSEQTDTESTKHDSATAASAKMPPPPSPVVPTGPAALSSVDHSQFYDHSSRGRGRGFYGGPVSSRGGARGRGAGYAPNNGLTHIPNGQHSLVSPVTPTTVAEPKGLGVEGAPKGPKAMREGLPNTGVAGSAKGFSIVGRASAAAQARSSGHTRSRSPSPSRSRSRSPHRSHRHRRHRHRSTDSSHSSDRDRKRERRHRHSRRYEDDDLVEDEESKAADSSSKRSSHRHRDDEKDREPGRSGHRSHRSHRDRSRRRDSDHHSSRKRSRSPATEAEKTHVVNGTSHMNGIPPTGPKADRQRAKEEELASSGRKKREREEDDDHYRERKRSKADFSESGENGDDRRASKRAHREDEDRSRTNKPQSLEEKAPGKSEPPTPKSEVDAHTLEREARNRERMQKEMQRRSAMDGKGSGPKRKMSGAGVGQGGRRVSYKYEDEESSEARASRVENEREAGRWG